MALPAIFIETSPLLIAAYEQFPGHFPDFQRVIYNKADLLC